MSDHERPEENAAASENEPKQNALQESEQWLRILVDGVEDHSIFSVNLSGKIATWNKGARALFGYETGEILGEDYAVIFTSEDRERSVPAREIERALREGHATDERWHVRKDGSRFFATGVAGPLRDEANKVCGFLKVVYDITDQRRLQDEFKQSEERYRLLVDSVKDFALFTFDLEGRISHWNPGAENLFGYSQEEILGQNTDRLFTPEDQAEGVPARERRIGLREGVEVSERWLARKDGSRLYVTEALRPMIDDSGHARGFTEVARDITERKQLENDLRHTRERLETLVAERTTRLRETVVELESFSYSLSHDLRAPLRAMQSFSQILRTDFGERLGAEGTAYLDKIISAAERLDKLIEDVLTFGRMTREGVRLEPVELEKLLHQLIAEQPALQPPRANISIASPLLKVLGHEVPLSQCLSNLLDNAVKFVAPDVPPRVRVWTEPLNGHVRVWVEDNGIGIPEEDQERIFGIFQRLHTETDYQGTGIGLAIVRKAVQRMGGQVGVESKPGKGSRFWLQLIRGEHL